MPVKLIAVLIAVLGGAPGCTIVTVRDALAVTQKFYPGMVTVSIEPSETRGTAVSLDSYGFVIGGSAATLGIHHEELIALPSAHSCQAVFLIRNERDTRAALTALEAAGLNNKGLCAMGQNGATP